MSESHWIYLSPHLDDAVYSCGGMLWEQVQRGFKVEIWTLFAGDPPRGSLTPFARSLHERWQSGDESAAVRRDEDIQACRILEAGWRHFDDPDCIYRLDRAGRPVIEGEADLFRAGYQGEPELVDHLLQILADELPDNASVVIPFGYGNHVDHQLVRRAAEKLSEAKWTGQRWLYADYPYAASTPENLSRWMSQPGKKYDLPVSAAGLENWQRAAAAYRSQISTFWKSTDELRQKISAYRASDAGSRLNQLI